MKITKRALSLLLALCMVCTLWANTGAAHAADPTDSRGTVAAPAETVAVTGEITRENNFNEGWKFNLGDSSTAQTPNYDDSGWESISLPHDFSISQAFTTSGEAESGFLPGGTGWYRKSFTLPAQLEGKTFLLNFDGAYMDTTVYVNGTYVGENHYGYTAFAFDITEHLHFDGSDNVIAVKVVNTVPTSRWYSGSGIYRDVTLFALAPVHVDYNGIAVTTPDIASGEGTARVAADIRNDSTSEAAVTVRSTVCTRAGEAVSPAAETTVTVPAGETVNAVVSPVVENPALWSVETPNLYVVRTEVLVDGAVVDTCKTSFGYRYFNFDSNGFHLNGQNVKLNGVCLHHDQGALGSAAYYDAMYRQLSIMKDMGANAIRTSHNPADEDFIRICDELGLLVMEEAFDGWSEYKNGNTNDFSRFFTTNLTEENGIYGGSSSMTWAKFALQSMIRRDRNSPSIIAWSLGNEIQEGTNWTKVSTFPTIAENLIAWVKEIDTSRPVTSGDNNRGGNSNLVSVLNSIVESGGVVGFNYTNTTSQLYSLAQQFGGVIIASETSSATNSRGIYSSQANNTNADGKYHLTSYDTSRVNWGITAHESIYNTYQYDCVAGEFVWTGFDYIGEPTPWNGTGTGSVSWQGAMPNSSYFGIVETTGFEKDTYYLYRSQWNKTGTTLHLLTAWDSENMYTNYSGQTPVVIYSNAPVVKLYRNGELIGTATRAANTSDAGHTYYTYTTESNNADVCTAVTGSASTALYATFNVTFASGNITARAFDGEGREITETVGKAAVYTPDAASQLRVTADKQVIAADGTSLSYLTVDVTDANGHLDTTATNAISFQLEGEGEIVGVDNGDQATTNKYQQASVLTSATTAQINAYAGKALVIVRSTKNAGSFTLTATASGLTGGTATVTTEASGEAENGLTSYTMVRSYTLVAGTVPTLDTAATGLVNGQQSVTGVVTWEEIGENIYGVAGDHIIHGVLRFEGFDPIDVTATLHVLDNIAAMRNISTVTMVDQIPTLPNVVRGVLADGTLSGEFEVTWSEMSESQFATVGDIIVVQGEAEFFNGQTMPVTASVRVAEEVNTESANVAPNASSLTQDIAAANQSDVLSSVNNGILKPGDNTSERWTNWNNRRNSATATLTFTWATAQTLSSANIYYYYDNCCATPESVVFKYSLDGTEYFTVNSTATSEETYNLGEMFSYTFDEVINPVFLQVIFTQQDGTTGNHCVGVTELELMTFAGKLEVNDSAALSGITVDGTPIEGFAPETYAYEANGSTVAATTDVNAGITVLPKQGNIIRILTVSEDGTDSRLYTVTVPNGADLEELRLILEAAEAAKKAAEEAQEAAEAAQEAAEQAKKDAEEAASSTAADKTAAEEAQKKAEEAQKLAEEAREAAKTAQKAAEEAAKAAEASNLAAAQQAAEAAKQAAAAATKANEAAASAAAATEAMQKAQAAQAAAEKARDAANDAQKKAEEAQKKAEEAAASAAEDKAAAEKAKAEAEAAKEAAKAAEEAAKQSEEAAKLAREAAEASNKAAAASAALAAEYAQKVAEQYQEIVELKLEMVKTLAKAQQDAADAEAARKAAEAAELASAKQFALYQLSEAALKTGELNEHEKAALEAALTAASEAIEKAETVEAVEKALADAKEAMKAALAACPAKNYTDVDLDAWYHEAVDYMLSKGYMNGVGGNRFDVDGSLTRAQLVTILYRVAGTPEVKDAKNPFTDVKMGEWYSDAILWAAENGIVKGMSETTFAPDGKITREQIATILYRYAKAEAVKEDKLGTFPDADKISDYAKDAMNWAVAEGIINGSDGKLLPQDFATRAQISAILMRYLEK